MKIKKQWKIKNIFGGKFDIETIILYWLNIIWLFWISKWVDKINWNKKVTIKNQWIKIIFGGKFEIETIILFWLNEIWFFRLSK